MEGLKQKKVLLLGATGGIGAELANLIHSSGAQLWLAGRDTTKLNQLAIDLSLETGRCFHVDLADSFSVASFTNQLKQFEFAFDIFINAAGIGIIKSFDKLSKDEMQTSFQVNTLSSFETIQAILPKMMELKKGLIINIPGILGKVPMAGAAAYCASKYALVGMMHSLREELKRTEIRITQLYLGGVDSPFWDTIDLRVQRDKMVVAQEAARAIWFLCQQPSSGVVSEMVLQPFNHQAI